MKLIPIPTTVTVIDTVTSRAEEKPATMHMLPAAAGKCQECAGDHAPDAPHNAQSLHYQYAFYSKHGRWPTWKDALAHCPEPVAKLWEEELRRLGAWSEPGPAPAPKKHETPLPKDALLQPGAKIDVLDVSDGRRKTGTIVAVVPKGVPAEFAEADQNGHPRPSSYTINRRRSTLYVVEVSDAEMGTSERWYVPQTAMKHCMDPQANRKAREKKA